LTSTTLTNGVPAGSALTGAAVNVLSALRGNAPGTLTELVAVTGLSRPTIEDALARLAALDLVEELAPGPGGRVGRPARLYRFRPDAGLVLGLDVGESRIIAVLADLTGEMVATIHHPVASDLPRDERLSAARLTIREVLSTAGHPRSRVWAAAAGTVGIVDARGHVLVCEMLPGWAGLNLAGHLRRSLACPVLVENDANMAALAEHWRGAAVGVDDVIYVLASHRLGAGILIGGRVHRGFGGAAGEIAGLNMLRWDTAAGHLTRGVTDPSKMDSAADQLFAAARAGDPAARKAVTTFSHDLASGIAAMALTIDPELVVVGGRVSRAADLLDRPLRQRLRELCVRPPRVTVSTLDDESTALGAVRTALDHVEKHVFGL
jgi:predicted NBD/HSP70 family sugar kinase